MPIGKVRSGAGISALVSSWLIICAVQDVWSSEVREWSVQSLLTCDLKASSSVWTQLLVFGFGSFPPEAVAAPFVSSDKEVPLTALSQSGGRLKGHPRSYATALQLSCSSVADQETRIGGQ